MDELPAGRPPTTRDRFVGGKVVARQPARGFRSASDAVLLAASVPARRGDAVLELGCGAGVAALCLACRVPGITLAGVEIDPFAAALAEANARENGVAMAVWPADALALPSGLRQQLFDHAFFNPPFFAPEATPSPDPARARARHAAAPLGAWFAAAARRVRPRGTVTAILRSEQLPEALAAMGAARLGSLRVLPLTARMGRDAERVVVQGVRLGRGGLRLHAPLVLHEGPAHRDGPGGHTDAAEAILRQAAPTALGVAGGSRNRG